MGGLALSSVAAATHNPDDHSPNMRLVARFDDGGTYRDRIYGNNLGTRGFDAFFLDEPDIQRDAVRLRRLNPQTMETVRARG